MSARYEWRDLSNSELRVKLHSLHVSERATEALIRNREDGFAIERMERLFNP